MRCESFLHADVIITVATMENLGLQRHSKLHSLYLYGEVGQRRVRSEKEMDDCGRRREWLEGW